MAQSTVESSVIRCPGISRQLAFHQLLVAARKMWLAEALREALLQADPRKVKEQLLFFAPSDTLKLLAASQIRDEHVFPVPIILETRPTLVGYYRLLAGFPQKSFYAAGTGMARFKVMETSNVIDDRQRQFLPQFCREMCRAIGDLIRQISPTVSAEDIGQLPLITLGSQFQGANNNLIGQQATRDVFVVIGKIAEPAILEKSKGRIVLQNSSGAKVIISLASDPDVRIQLQQEDSLRNKLAIEIKGGSDRSNAHNRAGEAEKSHQKARSLDYRECWTLIAKKGLVEVKLKAESPTTDQWFDVAQVLAEEGDDWEEFRSRLADILGIRLTRPPRSSRSRKRK